MDRPEIFTQRFVRARAIRYTGENWLACTRFMGLREEFDGEAAFDEVGNDGNIYPSMEHRTHFLCLPNRRHRSERNTVERGDWIVEQEDSTFVGMSDDEFQARYE